MMLDSIGELNITIYGAPRTKKNSQRLVNVNGRSIPLPSKAYKDYEKAALAQIPNAFRLHIESLCNVKCIYYMPARRAVDLNNLLEGTTDMLVRAGVLEDDNSRIVGGHDGSRVRHDKNRPRVEITISKLED